MASRPRAAHVRLRRHAQVNCKELAKERENKEKETAALQAKVAALEKVLSEQNAELSELAAKKALAPETA